jgi:hypothetical protein
MMRVFLAASSASFVMVSGCVEESCTEIGCQDQASFTVHAADDAWEAGEYGLGISFDGVATTSCHFVMPPDPATPGALEPLDCSPALDAVSFQAHLEQVTACVTSDNGHDSSSSCTPVPGRYHLSVMTTTMPASVSVTLARGAAEPYFGETQSFRYATAQPNGPSCEPTCRQGSAEFHVP